MNLFQWELADGGGVAISLIAQSKTFLKTTQKVLPIEDWSSGNDSKVLIGLSALTERLQDNGDKSALSLSITHSEVAGMTEQQAGAMNLPTSVPFQLRVWSEGKLIDNSFVLQSEFLDMGQPVYVNQRVGSILVIGQKQYRIPSPLYELCEIVKHFPEDNEGKLEAISKASSLLGIDSPNVASDQLLSNIKLRHVSAFSASISGNLADPELSPVLFSKHIIDGLEDSSEILDEAQQLLTTKQSSYFSGEFKNNSQARRTYLLDDGEYIYIDPSIRKAMEGFRQICSAPTDIRKAFVKAPTAVLTKYLDNEDNADQLVEIAFVETSQFSDRVTEINEWKVPDLPFLVKEANQWGTDVLIFNQVGSANTVIIPKDLLEEAVTNLAAAIDAGEKQLTFNGIDIPVSSDLLAEMMELLPIKPDPDQPDQPEEPEPINPDEVPRNGIFVVNTIDNFNAINFKRKKVPPTHPLHYKIPSVLVANTKPLAHQVEGVKWLINAFNQGMPGVLIADDMGLGKTLQALILLALYREQTPKSLQRKEQTPRDQKRPALIVAPKGLLKNWVKEVEIHLGANGLGKILEVYGGNLKQLRTGVGIDTNAGIPLLDMTQLSQADVVLTTYESLRDYQHSFSRVGFGCVVFDEIQKVKNPQSQVYGSAKALNGEFFVGLSGTPVENSLADLWSIFDVLAPGLLNFSLSDFVKLFSGDPEKEDPRVALEKLHAQLLTTADGQAPPILRRMKDVVFKDAGPDGKLMPKKIIRPASKSSQEMPPEQASLYTKYNNLLISKQMAMVLGLQAFKKISLSPKSAENWLSDSKESIATSARLSKAFEILDSIYSESEKVLIFVESRAVQPVLATIIKEKYGMKKLPLIINGAISGEARQNAVDQFQDSAAGFNAIIISPKAGGIGLTLTQANHVLHLERWWNPAIEDQCNDRAYRIGQKKDVTIYTPVARHPEFGDLSFDLVLDRILTRKRLLASSLFVPTELKPEDFGEMINPSHAPQSFTPISLEESYEIETGEAFEDYVRLSLTNSEFKVFTTPRSHDAGCDLLASFSGKDFLCQVKQVRRDKVLNNGVEQIIAAQARFAKAERLVLITNALSITGPQQDLARQHGVVVILGGSINKIGPELRSYCE